MKIRAAFCESTFHLFCINYVPYGKLNKIFTAVMSLIDINRYTLTKYLSKYLLKNITYT